MSSRDIVEQIAHLLQQHKDGLRGSIHQEPYKGDFFRLFVEAYNRGYIHPGSQNKEDYLSADALTDLLVQRAPDLLEDHAWQRLHLFWSEWAYAWQHAHLREP